MLGEERSPLVVEQGAVRLDRVHDPLARPLAASASSTERRKKSRPIIVGSPPCQATATSGESACASMSWRRYSSSRSSAILNLLPG